MGQDMRGNIAAIALLFGVVTATVATALSETGTFPLDRQENEVASSPSVSPSAPKVPVMKSSPSVTPSPHNSFGSLLVRKAIKVTPKSFAEDEVGSKQFSCLNSLWKNESEWDETAVNSDSGAFGIPQALPGSKMSSAGKDWKTNPITQVKWGIDYIEERYGTPCNAWQHWLDNNWY
jgi:hypothetical protein